jgi:hypothetical protein
MAAACSPAQQAASRTNGARSHGPVTEAGKSRSARNGTRHGLRGGPFALLAGEDRDAFAELHAAVTSDWGPRDAYERRWVMELVTSMWRQDRLRGLELAALDAAASESPPSEATVKKLATFARYGARIDKDMATALQALRALRKRPDAWLEKLQDDTREPGAAEAPTRNFTNELSPRTLEPKPVNANEANGTSEPCLVDLWHGGGRPPRARGGRAGSEIDPNPGC